MRDAVHVQKFRIPPDALDEPAILNASVRRVIDQRKHQKDDTEKKNAERGVHGRGSRAHGGPARGRGHGSDGPMQA